MSARLLNPRASLLALLGDIRYTLARLQANPFAGPLVAEFQDLREEWMIVQAQEIENQEELSDAQALVDVADIQLAAFAGRVSKMVLALVKNDRNHPIYLHFYGDNSQSLLARPHLGVEILEMRPWLTSIETSPHPSLQALAAELGILIVAITKAISTLDAVRAKIRKFCDQGARYQLFERCNEARSAAFEALTRLAKEKPGLPSDYANGFFRADSGEAMPTEQSAVPSTPHPRALDLKVAAAKVQLEKLEEAAQEEREAERVQGERLSS